MKNKSLKDIANELGLSKTTVSFVLNNKGDEMSISKKTQTKIKAYVQKVDYQINHVAKSLKNGRTNTIAFIVPDISDPFYARLSRKIEDLFLTNDFQLQIGSTDENLEKLELQIKKSLNQQVDGLILASSSIHNETIKTLISKQVPLIILSKEASIIKVKHVSSDKKERLAQSKVELISSTDCPSMAAKKSIEKLFELIH